MASVTTAPLNVPPISTPYATYQPSPTLPRSDLLPTKISNLRPGMRGLTLDVIVIDKFVVSKRRPVYLIWVGDDSGSVIFSTLMEDIGEKLFQGNMLHMTNCETRLFAGSLQVTIFPNTGKVERYSEMLQVFEPEPNMSHHAWEPDETKAGWILRKAPKKSATWYIPPAHPTLRPAPGMMANVSTPVPTQNNNPSVSAPAQRTPQTQHIPQQHSQTPPPQQGQHIPQSQMPRHQSQPASPNPYSHSQRRNSPYTASHLDPRRRVSSPSVAAAQYGSHLHQNLQTDQSYPSGSEEQGNARYRSPGARTGHGRGPDKRPKLE
ncbi:hypothetical protein DFS34DRAFT_324682 [Phlyctochytrium arcticum]|nr:hypothetical protein DFS34DRAFT_324682 [Phlyctochytrium arcticum]